MLNKIKSLQYQFTEQGEITEVSVSFNDYNGNPNGNLNMRFKNDDGRLDSLSPKQIQEIAKQEILAELSKNNDEEVEEPIEEEEV